jgi:hypothetical protein
MVRARGVCGAPSTGMAENDDEQMTNMTRITKTMDFTLQLGYAGSPSGNQKASSCVKWGNPQ